MISGSSGSFSSSSQFYSISRFQVKVNNIGRMIAWFNWNFRFESHNHSGCAVDLHWKCLVRSAVVSLNLSYCYACTLQRKGLLPCRPLDPFIAVNFRLFYSPLFLHTICGFREREGPEIPSWQQGTKNTGLSKHNHAKFREWHESISMTGKWARRNNWGTILGN